MSYDQETYAPQGAAPQPSGSALSIMDIVMMLKRRAIWIVVATVLVTALGTLYVHTLTPLFRAQTTVLIDSRKKNIIELDSVVSGLSNNTPTIESEVEVLLTTSIARRVIKKLDLTADTEFGAYYEDDTEGATATIPPAGKDNARLGDDPVAEMIDGVTTAQTKPTPAGLVRAPISLALEYFADNLRVNRIRNTFLIRIRIMSKSAEKAALIANATADAYMEEQVQAKLGTANLATNWLQERIEQLRLNVQKTEEEIQKFKSGHNWVETEGFRLEERQLARTMEQMILSRAQKAEALAKYNQVRDMLNNPQSRNNLQDVLKSHTIRTLKDQQARITRREAELRTRYGSRHPEIKKVLAEVKDINRQIEAEVSRIVANLRNEYQIAVDREKSLSDSVQRGTSKTTLSNEKAIRLKELQREAKASQEVYNHFLLRYKQTAEQTRLQLPDARIVQVATVPFRAFWPRKKRLLAMFVAGGLIIGLAIAFALEFFGSNGIRSADDVERALDLPHLASLPDNPELAKDPRGDLKALRMSLLEPGGSYAEAVRQLRATLDRLPRQHGGRMVLITSTLENEGKTSLSSNLAQSFATAGHRTLLIDADIRNPSLSCQLTPRRGLGLLDCLQRRLPIERAILRDSKGGVHFLPAASPQIDPWVAADVIASSSMAHAINRLREQFDVIIVDTPPVLPISDTQALADFADNVVFAVRWKKTPKQLTQRALRNLSANIHKVSGIVLSRMDSKEINDYHSIPRTHYERRSA